MHLIPVGLSNKIASYFVNLPPISNDTYNKVFATNSFLIHFISIFFTSMLVISLWHPVIKKLWHDIRNRATPKWLLIICLVTGGTHKLSFPVVVFNLWPNGMFSNLFFFFFISQAWYFITVPKVLIFIDVNIFLRYIFEISLENSTKKLPFIYWLVTVNNHLKC